jgi:hypothetical protein
LIHYFKTAGASSYRKGSRFVLLAGVVAGLGFFYYYYSHHLTIAHFDAKAHLLVARRIVDSVEPGYGQMGVNWLPLVHLIYLPFIIFDFQYRTGLIPSLISVTAFAVSGWLAYRISCRLTGSIAAGLFAAFVLLANGNLEYIQSCPLTEPLYMVLLLLAADSLISWRESTQSGLPWLSAIWCSLGALCRYEGWFFLAGVLILLFYDYSTQYIPRQKAVRGAIVYAGVFGLPAAAHFGYIFFLLRDNFFHRVAAGNPDPYVTYKRPFLSLLYHWGELSQIASILPILAAAIGFLLLFTQREEFKRRVPLLLLWLPSIINISALYWGLIYRVRYSVLLIPAVCLFGSLAIASSKAKERTFILLSAAAMAIPFISWCLPHISQNKNLVPGPGIALMPVFALLLFLIARACQCYSWPMIVLCILGMQVPSLERENMPIIVETMEHEFIEPQMREVIDYFQRYYDGKRILIDMGKLAPLVYDSGLPVKEFVYNEGGEKLWNKAFQNPAREVGWICMQKGDAISERLQVDPKWLDEYALALKTEYFSIYHLKP